MLKNRKKGFTLIELIVVIAILGILAAVLIPKFTGFTDKAKKTQALTDAKQFATAMDSLYAEKGAGAFNQTDVEVLSGTLKSSISGFNATTGAFTATYTPAGSSDTYSAGRASYNDSVTATP